MDFEEEVVKKKNKCKAKRKERLVKFYIFVKSLLSLYPKFFPFLLLHSVLTFVPTPMTTLVFYSGSSIVLSFWYMPVLVFYPKSPVILSTHCMFALVSCSKSSIILLSCYIPAFILVLNFLLLHYLIVCLLQLHLQLFLCLIMFLFLIAEF